MIKWLQFKNQEYFSVLCDFSVLCEVQDCIEVGDAVNIRFEPEMVEVDGAVMGLTNSSITVESDARIPLIEDRDDTYIFIRRKTTYKEDE